MKSYRSRPKLYEVSVVADQVYSHAGDRARLADLYLPKLKYGKIPVVLWLHEADGASAIGTWRPT